MNSWWTKTSPPRIRYEKTSYLGNLWPRSLTFIKKLTLDSEKNMFPVLVFQSTTTLGISNIEDLFYFMHICLLLECTFVLYDCKVLRGKREVLRGKKYIHTSIYSINVPQKCLWYLGFAWNLHLSNQSCTGFMSSTKYKQKLNTLTFSEKQNDLNKK